MLHTILIGEDLKLWQVVEGSKFSGGVGVHRRREGSSAQTGPGVRARAVRAHQAPGPSFQTCPHLTRPLDLRSSLWAQQTSTFSGSDFAWNLWKIRFVALFLPLPALRAGSLTQIWAKKQLQIKWRHVCRLL